MLTYPEIDPIIVELGPLALRWYGLTYLIGFGLFWWLGRLRAKRPDTPVEAKHIDDLVFYGALGAVIGGRIGYMLFYNTAALLENPISLFYIHQGGMAFHGGFLGALAVALWMKRKIGCGFLQLTDFVAPLVPLGFGAGRIGNFINGELWGGPGNVPWAMRVSCEQARFHELCFQQLDLPAGSAWTPPLHPSQLYQFALEGLALFIILWLFTKRPRPVGAASGLFLLGYGAFRFLVEFVRMPDAHLDYIALGWVTMGQILSLPMILGGLGLMIWAYKKR